MDRVKLVPGEFLKNAGIVGFLRLLQNVKEKQNVPFAVTDEIDVEELLKIDLAEEYIDVFVKYYGAETKTAKAFELLDRLVESLEGNVNDVDRKRLQEETKSVSDSLSANSLQSGFEGIKDEIADKEVYSDFIAHKLKIPGPKEDIATVKETLLPRLKSLQRFCAQPLVRSIFTFKMIVYNVINNFWTDKCFLLRANAKTKVTTLIKSDFTEPLVKYLTQKEQKPKSCCISCGGAISGDKEKTSLAFLVDMADDLARKSSVFWNCKPDAFLCPICAFLYAIAPLGFCQVDNGDFVFINANDSVETLWNNNQPKIAEDGKRQSYHERIDHAILQILESKTKIVNNVQVITRSMLESRYHFNVIDRDLISLGLDKSVKSSIASLAKRPSFKMANGDFVNVYRECIANMLNYRNQYNLLSMLVMESLKQPWVNCFLRPVFEIQRAQLTLKEEHFMDLSKMQYYAGKAGGELRPRLIADKLGLDNAASVADDKKEDIIRGVVYQLTNALKVQNVEQFADLIIRLYSSCKLPIPPVFMQALQPGDQFAVVGYAFVLGLKNAFYVSKDKDKETTNNKENTDNKGENYND